MTVMWSFFLAALLGSSSLADECSLGEVRDCTVPHGTGYMHCPDGKWTACVVATCEFGYYIGGAASMCAPVPTGGDFGDFNLDCILDDCSYNYSLPTSTTTVTVVTTVVDTSTSVNVMAGGGGGGGKPGPAVAQKDAYCQGAALQFGGAANQLRKGQAEQAVKSYVQAQQLVKRAGGMGGVCGGPELESYLVTDEQAKVATERLEKETGLKAGNVAEQTRAPTDGADSAAAGLKALAAKMSKEAKKASLAALEKLGGKKAGEIAAAAAEGSGEGEAGSAGSVDSSDPAISGEGNGVPMALAPSPTQTSTAVAAPTRPKRMSDASLDELEHMLGRVTGDKAKRILEETKMREFTLFARVKRAYRRRQGGLEASPYRL